MTEPEAHPLIRQHRITVVPGVYDVLSAKIASRCGFHSVVLTGYGFAAAHLGEPDLGLFTQTEILDCARRITAAVPIGVIVDGDTGHGGPLNVQRMVRELVRMGARGVILEDQTWPKRCGHMRGKSVIDAAEHVEKIHAAKEAKGDAPFIITARTDALETHGIDEALRRALVYKDAGAEVLFVEAPRTRQEIERIGKELPGPLAINLIEDGKTPLLSLEELEALGFYSVGFVLSGLFAAAHALEKTYREIRSTGSTAGVRSDLATFHEFADLIGLEQRYADDERFRAPT